MTHRSHQNVAKDAFGCIRTHRHCVHTELYVLSALDLKEADGDDLEPAARTLTPGRGNVLFWRIRFYALKWSFNSRCTCKQKIIYAQSGSVSAS